MRLAGPVATALAAGLALAAGAALADPSVPEPAGYRSEPYRAPVPDTLAGATVLDAAGVAAWQQAGAVLIDALPALRRPDGLPAGTLWRAPPHESLPGAAWLAGMGYDRLSAADERRFADALDRLTGGDKGAALVFFCKADCWMGWNAAKRALAWGHSRVGWFPQGVEGWTASGRPLAPVEPAQ